MVLLGCAGKQEAVTAPVSESATPKPPPVARVSDRPANLEGSVFIVEYHKIAKEEARWDRSIARFKADLERYYAMGFRPVTLKSYLEDSMSLPPGASPIIFTFDDSHPSQFRYLDDGSIDPDCAVGIWSAFAEKHPDFPVRATFFVIPSSGPFGPAKDAPKKLAQLKEWGCEVGSHTLTHRKLSSLPPAEVEKELGGAVASIEGYGFEPFAIALPYGISPKDPAQLKKHHSVALLVGANPAPAPGSAKRNPMRLPRIQCIEGDFGITYWLDQVRSGRVKPYVAP